MTRVAIGCGHTGGHLIPARLIAECFNERGVGVTLYSTLDPGHWLVEGFPGDYNRLHVGSWVGRTPAGKIGALISGSGDYARIRSVMPRYRACLGLGGYASVPMLLASWERGIPLFLQEQNRMPGRSNRLFAPFCQTLFCGFPLAESTRAPRTLDAGNPVRRRPPRREEWFRSAPVLLVMGGSQGARALSEALGRCGPELLRVGWHIFYVKGRFGRDLSGASWADSPGFRQVRFEPDIPSVMSVARCAWVRAGAGTLSELMYYGLPGLVFPLETSADDHQRRNTDWVASRGPARPARTGDPTSRLVEWTLQCSDQPRHYRVDWWDREPPEHRIVKEVLGRC